MLYYPLYPNSIRLAKFSPSTSWPDRIVLEMFPVSLDGHPPYTALSYVWGSPKAQRRINVHCTHEHHSMCELYITANLFRALRRLYLSLSGSSEQHLFWVDAICIDQDNVAERNRQVRLMRTIYSSSERVVVFLGEVLNAEFATKFATTSGRKSRITNGSVTFYNDARDDDIIQSFLNAKTGLTGTKDHHADTFCFIRLLAHEPERILLADMDLQTRQDLFEALRLMMHFCRWWSRVWVIQEVVLPDNVTVQYGSMVAPWEMFFQAAQQWTTLRLTALLLPEYAKVLDDMSRRILEIEDMRRAYRTSGRAYPLLLLLRQFSGRMATDPRDKVYALTGMTGGQLSYVEPDYALPVSTVFQNTVVDMVREMQSLDPITGDLASKYSTELPSWAPDWSSAYSHLDRCRLENMKHYRATLDCKVFIQEEGPTLRTLRDGIEAYMQENGVNSGDHVAYDPSKVQSLENDEKQLAEMERHFAARGIAACLRDHGHGLLCIIGSYVDTVAVVGEVRFPDVDVVSIVHSWKELVVGENKSHSNVNGIKVKEAFARTICGDLMANGNEIGDGFRRMSEADIAQVELWLRRSLGGLESPTPPGTEVGATHDNLEGISDRPSFDRVYNSINVATSRRRFFITERLAIGLGPAKTRVGDSVHILLGGKSPFILRAEGDCGRVGLPSHIPDRAAAVRIDHEVIGDCYVHGMMDGEEMPLRIPDKNFEVDEWIWEEARLAQSYELDVRQGHGYDALRQAGFLWLSSAERWENEIIYEPATFVEQRIRRVNILLLEARKGSRYRKIKAAIQEAHEAASAFAVNRQEQLKMMMDLPQQYRMMTDRDMNQTDEPTLGTLDPAHPTAVAQQDPLEMQSEAEERDKRMREARERLAGLEYSLLFAESRLRSIDKTWLETLSLDRLKEPEVKKALEEHREVVSAWAQLVEERWYAAADLWRFDFREVSEDLSVADENLAAAGEKWIMETRWLSETPEEVGAKYNLKWQEEVRAKYDLKWHEAATRWEEALQRWRNSVMARLDRTSKSRAWERRLQGAEQRLNRVIKGEHLLQTALLGKNSKAKPLSPRMGRLDQQKRDADAGYVYLV